MDSIRNIAVVLAGGMGSRVGGTVPKQLLPLEDGRSVLEHAIAAFAHLDCINGVLVVMHPDYLDVAQSLCQQAAGDKLIAVVPGGRERWESSVHAIDAVVSRLDMWFGAEAQSKASMVNLLLHDAARPFVSERIIRDVCVELAHHPAVTVAVPATDTMYCVETPSVDRVSVECQSDVTRLPVNACPRIVAIPDRKTMMRAQTPQAFRLDVIQRAYQLAMQDAGMQVTDDCGVVHHYMPELPIHIVDGEETNRKITFKEDL